jgi:hypothetical protein
MCSVGGGGAAVRKVMRVLMVAMLPGFVEAAGLVRDACKTFGGDAFGYGCDFGCGASLNGACPATERTPAECDTKCVRHRPHVLLAPPASPTAALRVRFTTVLHTLVL